MAQLIIFCNSYYVVSGIKHKTRYLLCCSPVCLVYTQYQVITWYICEEDMSVSKSYQRWGYGVNQFKKMVVYCYTDAYFAGLWVHENTQDPICDRSSTGLLVPFPIVLCCWCKKFRHRFLSLLYILSIWNFLIMLYNYFPWKLLSRNW